MSMKLIWDGIQLMVFGMGTVYVFLMIMILCMGILKKALAPFAGMLEKAPAPKKTAPGKTAASSDDVQLAAIAAAAVEMARK